MGIENQGDFYVQRKEPEGGWTGAVKHFRLDSDDTLHFEYDNGSKKP